MWTISLQREKRGKAVEGDERQGQFALSKRRCLLLSFEASHQSRARALGSDGRKDASCSESACIVYKVRQLLGKITAELPKQALLIL